MRKHLSYQNVVSTLAVFLLLAGGTAFAASKLGKNSVGTKQLKRNAVTAAKIKKNAVTAAKIRNGAVSRAKIADGSVSGADIDAAGTSFGRFAARITGAGTVAYPAPALYPLANPVYTQNAGEINEFHAYVDIRFAASCPAPRAARAFLVLDSADPLDAEPEEVIGIAAASDDGAGEVTRRAQFASGYGSTISPLALSAPGAPVQHSLAVVLGKSSACGAGGIAVTAAGIDVIGIR